jgi:hypothetical protein
MNGTSPTQAGRADIFIRGCATIGWMIKSYSANPANAANCLPSVSEMSLGSFA